MNRTDFEEMLKEYGQEKFLKVFDKMNDVNRQSILEQADMLDFSMVAAADPEAGIRRGTISPIKTLTIEEQEKNAAEYRAIGLKAIHDGKIGALLLAGGMGTRLGYDHAKGMYNIGLTHDVFIFQRIVENLLEVVREAGCFIHLYIMTSLLNHSETVAFFKEHEYFGYDGQYVHFFMQNSSPCLTENREIFLESEGKLAVSPNGNGGFYSSLMNSEFGTQLHDSGVEYLNFFAVDNVLQKPVDPVFTGAVIKSGCATGAKVVVKVSPDERVGAICLEDGRPSVVEYYDMTDELKAAKAEDGTFAYNYGVILNYLFRVRDIDEVVRTSLPVHMVFKKVAYLAYEDGSPVTVTPDTPNAYKLETLSLDLVHLTDSCLSFEVEREKEFAPIKNATGADSVESARALLEKNGYVL